MNETGVVKFRCEHIARKLERFVGFEELSACRDKLRDAGLIGVDENGIGFGNVSRRDGLTNAFYITGSGTGALPTLTPEHFAKVTAHDFATNWLRCEGATVASSESLTHAAIYQAAPAVRAVLHCHSSEIWQRLLNVAPTTSPQIEYGTPAMAAEVRRLFVEGDLATEGIFVMAGHTDGIVAFGGSVDEAYRILTAR